jgi:hypothetical protein
MRLSNPRQDRARSALALEQLSKAERKTITFHVLRFTAAIQAQRKFDADVAAALERLLCDPAHRARIVRLISPEKDTADALHR